MKVEKISIVIFVVSLESGISSVVLVLCLPRSAGLWVQVEGSNNRRFSITVITYVPGLGLFQSDELDY